MKIILFCLLVSMAVCYRKIQYETGADVLCAFNTKHILEVQATVPRSIEKEIKFKKEFPVVPQVAPYIQILDWESGQPSGFDAHIVSVDTKSFKIRLTAVSPRKFYSFYFKFLAVYDPSIQIHHFETTNIAPLKAGSGNREVQLTLPINFPEVQTGVAYLMGVKSDFTTPIMEVKLTKVMPKEATVIARTYQEARVQMIRVCVILGTEKNLWVSPEFNFAATAAHPFARRAPGVASLPITVEPPKIWQTGERVALALLRGYAYDQSLNFRLNLDKVSLTNKLSYEVVTWWDSRIFVVHHSSAIYAPDTSLKIFDENCAELFSECNFSGDSITVCDRISDLPEAGWSKPIKSVKVPVQRRLYLFNDENFVGKRVFYSEDQKCLKDINFTFVQLEHNDALSGQQ